MHGRGLVEPECTGEVPSDFSIQVLQEHVYEHLNRCVPHTRHFWVDKKDIWRYR